MTEIIRVKDAATGDEFVAEHLLGKEMTPGAFLKAARDHGGVTPGPNYVSLNSDPVIVDPVPAHTRHEVPVRSEAPVLIGGDYHYTYTIVSKLDVLNSSEADDYKEDYRESRLRELSLLRYDIEVGGISIPELNNAHVGTDRDTQINLGQVKQAMDVDNNLTVEWKMNGDFNTLNKLAVDAMYAAVVTHKQLCFANEKKLTLDINNASDIAALDAIDLDAGWPA